VGGYFQITEKARFDTMKTTTTEKQITEGNITITLHYSNPLEKLKILMAIPKEWETIQ